jgi:hypothetical protein
MKIMALMAVCTGVCASLVAGNYSGSLLDSYKFFLESGTYDGQDWSSFSTRPKSRYDTFKACFENFEDIQGKVIVELGTSRSFTHGGHIGCNSNDLQYWFPDDPEKWDWGAGFFTRMVAHCTSHLNPDIHTVDLCSSHIERCKVMTSDFQDIISYHVMSSVDFLKNPFFTPIGNQLDLAMFLGFVAVLSLSQIFSHGTNSAKYQVMPLSVLVFALLGVGTVIFSYFKAKESFILTPFNLSWYAAIETLKQPLNGLFGVGVDNYAGTNWTILFAINVVGASVELKQVVVADLIVF